MVVCLFVLHHDSISCLPIHHPWSIHRPTHWSYEEEEDQNEEFIGPNPETKFSTELKRGDFYNSDHVDNHPDETACLPR